MIGITKEEFMAYEGVRVSGVTNMFAISVVMNISKLSQDKVIKIMENYDELRDKYLKNGEGYILIENPLVRSEKNKVIDNLVNRLKFKGLMGETFIKWAFEEFENREGDFDWDYYKMMADDSTAYDEVAREIRDIAISFIPHDKARTLLEDKLKQLMRLLDDEL